MYLQKLFNKWPKLWKLYINIPEPALLWLLTDKKIATDAEDI